MMGEVIAFPINNDKKKQHRELLLTSSLECPKCKITKEEDWFILYNDHTYLCVDCSYEQGEK